MSSRTLRFCPGLQIINTPQHAPASCACLVYLRHWRGLLRREAERHFSQERGCRSTECWPSPDGVVVHRSNVCQEHLLGMLHHSGQVAHEPSRVHALSAPATWTVSLALRCEADAHISQFMPNALVSGIVEHAREILPDTQRASHHQLETSTAVMICSAAAEEVNVCKASFLGSYGHPKGRTSCADHLSAR